jgi:hypothetical protein
MPGTTTAATALIAICATEPLRQVDSPSGYEGRLQISLLFANVYIQSAFLFWLSTLHFTSSSSSLSLFIFQKFLLTLSALNF